MTAIPLDPDVEPRPVFERRHGPSPLPSPRGPLSAWLVEQLRGAPGPLPAAPEASDDPLTGEDTHLALYLCYELAYRGVAGVDEAWEWQPDLLAVRAGLEARFETALRDVIGEVGAPEDVTAFLQGLLTGGGGPSLSGWVEAHADHDQIREQAIHRSPYQLKEADPHTWAIPRLSGRPKAALVEIQADEYGNGVEADIHAELFALTMDRLGLSPVYNHYLDVLPGVTLANVNLVSMFGLHRRHLGALIGHLAVFEMASTTTMSGYAAALRRLGFDPWTRLFYDTHVVADAHHQTVAATDLAAGLVDQQPQRAADVAFGALALGHLEGRITAHLLDAWESGRSSLLGPYQAVDPAPGQILDPVPAEDPRPVR